MRTGRSNAAVPFCIRDDEQNPGNDRSTALRTSRTQRVCRTRPSPRRMSDRGSGYLLVVLAAALWAVIGPVSRLLLREGIPPLEMAFWRAVVAWVVFVVHALVQRRSTPF